jgi:hypothetical protein
MTFFQSLSHDSTTDNDKDGYSDLEEYLNGTDPNEGVTVTPTPTPTITPTVTPTVTSIPTSTPTPTANPTLTPTSSPTPVTTPQTLLLPVSDATVFASYPTSNFSNSTKLAANLRPEISSYLLFNLADQRGKVFSKAVLRLYVTSPASSNTTQNLYSASSNDWVESLITYKNRPQKVARIGAIHGSKSNKFVEFNITDYIKKNLGNSITFIITNSNNDRIEFASREDKTNSPQLLLY